MFDVSNYPKDSKFYDPSIMNEIGKMEDECKGKMNDECAGLKSKIHSLTDVDCKENLTGKGVNKNVVKITIHKEFADVF